MQAHTGTGTFRHSMSAVIGWQAANSDAAHIHSHIHTYEQVGFSGAQCIQKLMKAL